MSYDTVLQQMDYCMHGSDCTVLTSVVFALPPPLGVHIRPKEVVI